MRGKKTFMDGLHPSRFHRCGGVEITPAYRQAIERHFTRGLTESEFERLCEGVERTMDFQAAGERNPTAQDVKVTLNAIIILRDPMEVAKAYRQCDAQTRALIRRSLHLLGGPPTTAPEADLIRSAAADGLMRFGESQNGRKKEFWRPYFAGFAQRFWLSMGHSNARAYIDAATDEPSPFLSFAITLLAAANHAAGKAPHRPDAVNNIFKEFRAGK